MVASQVTLEAQLSCRKLSPEVGFESLRPQPAPSVLSLLWTFHDVNLCLLLQLLCSPLPLLDRVLSLQNRKPKDTLHATKSLGHSVLSPQEKSNWYNQLI